jgi:hypothetical protein
MAPNKISTRSRNHGLDIPGNAGFDTADVRDQCSTFQVRSELPGQGFHPRQWSAENNQIRAAHSFGQVRGSRVHSSASDTFPEAANTPDKTRDLSGQAAISQGETQGSAQHTNADNGRFSELHRRIFRVPTFGFKLVTLAGTARNGWLGAWAKSGRGQPHSKTLREVRLHWPMRQLLCGFSLPP